MVLQANGIISISNIKNEFFGNITKKTSISNYYRNFTNVINLPLTNNRISFSTFYNVKCILGDIIFTNIGNSSWIVPNGVNMISVICIGGGGSGFVINSSSIIYTPAGNVIHSAGGGGGGALAYIKYISVNPGSIFTITVGSNGSNGTSGEDSYITNNIGVVLVRAGGGKGGKLTSSSTIATADGGAGGTVIVGNGGNGGNGGTVSTSTSYHANYGGGGGAGGYNGNGGNGGDRLGTNRTNGAGGGGGGGWGARSINGFSDIVNGNGIATRGGGTAIYGRGNDGLASSSENVNGFNGSTNIKTGLSIYGYGSGARSTGTSIAGQGVVRIIYGTNTVFISDITIISNSINSSFTYISGNTYYYVFSSISGTNSITFPCNINCQILIVGGGGGGGGGYGGAGGAGGNVYYNNSYNFLAGTYNITVGAGGAGGIGYNHGVNNATKGSTGGSSYIMFGTNKILNANGGTGGGAPGIIPGGRYGNGGNTFSSIVTNNNVVNTNYIGGDGYYDFIRSGGGAGASSNGTTATNSIWGNGGNGYDSSITGTPTYYAGGAAGVAASTRDSTEAIDGLGASNYGGGGRGGWGDGVAGFTGKNGCIIISLSLF